MLALAAFTVPHVHAAFSWEQVISQSSMQSGDLTSYGTGNDYQGACSYGANFANTVDLPWRTGTDLTLALNNDQFGGSAACGLCVMYRGLGSGLGTVPIPTDQWTFGLVTNICPECAHGSLDLANDGNGRWKGEWFAVPCNVGDTRLTYSIVVSSYYWFSMVVSNTRVPVANVSAKIGDSWIPLQRGTNNQWAYYNSAGPWEDNFPMGVRVTSVTGETIDDAVPSKTGGDGGAQFAEVGDFNGLSSSVTSKGSIPPNTGLSGGAPTTTTTTTTSPSASSLPSPTIASSPAPAQASPSPAAVASPSPVAAASPSPATSSPAAGEKYDVGNYNQCGGTKGVCGPSGSPCVAAPWPQAQCTTADYTCQSLKGSTEFFSCQPGSSGGSSPAAITLLSPAAQASPSPAAAQASPSPAAQAPPPAAAQPFPSPAAVAASPSPAIEGRGLSPTLSPSPVSSSPAAVSSPYTSSPGLVASSALSSPVAASPLPSPATDASPSPSGPSGTGSGGAFAIGAGYQCGGIGFNCGQSDTTCIDAVWSKAYCPSGYSCQRQYAQLWTCSVQDAVATGGRRLLRAQ